MVSPYEFRLSSKSLLIYGWLGVHCWCLWSWVQLELVVFIGAVPLATLKQIDETPCVKQITESWRHLLIHEVSSEGELVTVVSWHCLLFVVVICTPCILRMCCIFMNLHLSSSCLSAFYLVQCLSCKSIIACHSDLCPSVDLSFSTVIFLLTVVKMRVSVTADILGFSR